MTSDNKYLFTASIDKSIKMIDLNTKQEVYHFKDIFTGTNYLLLSLNSFLKIDWIITVAVSSDNSFIASASFDRSIKVFNIATKHQTHQFIDAHLGERIFPPTTC